MWWAWKNFPRTNTQAYYAPTKNTSFERLTPDACRIFVAFLAPDKRVQRFNKFITNDFINLARDIVQQSFWGLALGNFIKTTRCLKVQVPYSQHSIFFVTY